ncbi:MAG: hypothetical protein VW683_06435 [Betaproteobacteria bacterium]
MMMIRQATTIARSDAMIIVAVILSGCLIWYLSELQRQISEIEESLLALHKDFAEEMYKRYMLEERDKDGEE